MRKCLAAASPESSQTRLGLVERMRSNVSIGMRNDRSLVLHEEHHPNTPSYTVDILRRLAVDRLWMSEVVRERAGQPCSWPAAPGLTTRRNSQSEGQSTRIFDDWILGVGLDYLCKAKERKDLTAGRMLLREDSWLTTSNPTYLINCCECIGMAGKG
jgi:hypothetical protein